MASNVNVKAIITAEDKASAVIKDVGSNVSDVAKKIGASMIIAGAGLTLLAKNATDFTVDYVKNIKDIERETGATTKESSQLLYVTNRLGIQAEESSQIFGFLSKQIVATGKSADASETALGRLGVTVKNTDGSTKSFNDILLDVADKFKALPNGAEKTATAMELFGRSGKDMIPVLNQGSDGIKDLQTQAEKLGLTLDSTTIGQISKFIESQKKLKDSTTAMKLAIGETTAPILTEFNNKLSATIGFLLNGDPAVRDITAGFLAFGGPILTATGALITFGANLTTIVANAGAAQRAIASFVALSEAQLLILRGTWIGTVAMMAAPIVLPAIAIGAAIFALGQVISKYFETKSVVEETTANIKQSTAILNGAIDQLNAKANAGNIHAQKSLQQMGLGGPATGMPRFATGGFTGTGGMNEIAGTVHKGEYVIPKSAVDQNTGMPKIGGAGGVNIIIQAGAFMGNDVDARKYAQKILQSMQEIAGSKNMSLGQMIG